MWGKQEWAVFAVFFIFAAFFTRTYVDTNDGSRMNAVQSIVERGTFIIDDSRFLKTSDKVRINDHWYSDKPPLSYLIAVPLYFALYHLGLGFTTNYGGLGYAIITILTVDLITSIMFVYFFRFLKRYPLTDAQRWLFTLALGVGTQLVPYRLMYNNHALGAALLFLSYYAWLHVKTPRQFFWTGLLVGFTAAIDLVSGGVFLALFAITLYRKYGKEKTARYVLGGAIFPVLGWLINYWLSGSFAYFSVQPALWNYTGSLFNPANLAGVVLLTPMAALHYAGPMLVGWKHGFLSFNPLLIFAIIGLALALTTKNKYRTEATVVSIGTLVVFLYYIFRTSNYGGCGWGFRYTLPLIPLLFVFVPIPFLRKDRWVKYYFAAFYVTFAASVLINGLGIFNPWSCNPINTTRIVLEKLRQLF